MAMDATALNLFKINKYIDTWQDKMIADLRDVCAIKSIAGSAEHYDEMAKMVKWIETRLRLLRATTCERFDIGCYVADGKTLRLPTVVLASFGKDSKKKTILVYGMYDVKAVDAEQWEGDPWNVHLRGSHLYGRGTCRGKAQLLSWFHAIEAYVQLKIPLPVNIKFVIEGMSERNCFGLEEFLYTKRITFMKGIDYVMINQSEWLNDTIPCISYGTCGICQFALIVSKGGGEGGGGGGEGGSGGDGDGDSNDGAGLLDYILSNFVDELGNILVPNINNDVVQITPEIEQSFDKINCDLSKVTKFLPKFMHGWSKQRILLRMWQMPQLILGGPAEEVSCTCDEAGGGGSAKGGAGGGGGGGQKDGLMRNFVFKIVPVQTPDRCAQFIMEHIVNLMKKKFPGQDVVGKRSKNGKSLVCSIGSEKFVRCQLTSSTRAWQEDQVSPHYEAVKRASARVFKYPPNMIKESTESQIILILDKVGREWADRRR